MRRVWNFERRSSKVTTVLLSFVALTFVLFVVRWNPSAQGASLCVLIRVSDATRSSAATLMQTLFVSAEQANVPTSLRLFLVNIAKVNDEAYVHEVEEELAKSARWATKLLHLHPHRSGNRHSIRALNLSELEIPNHALAAAALDPNGFVTTDYALQRLLLISPRFIPTPTSNVGPSTTMASQTTLLSQRNTERLSRAPRATSDDDDGIVPNQQQQQQCSHFLVTNADNLYSNAYFAEVMPEVHAGKKLVAVAHVGTTTGFHQQAPVLVGSSSSPRVSLGSVIFSRDFVEQQRFFVLDERKEAANEQRRTEEDESRVSGEFFRRCARSVWSFRVALLDKLLLFCP